MDVKRLLVTTGAVLLLAAVPAWADSFLTPFLGVTFGGDTTENQTAFGVSLGAGEIVGFELDFSRAPDFFGDAAVIGDNQLTTFMGNLVIGVPMGAVRPYATVGVGLLRSHIDGPGGALDKATSDLGVNIGGGLMGYFSEHLGARVDLRYFRNATSDDQRIFDFDLGSLDFWRFGFGVVWRF